MLQGVPASSNPLLQVFGRAQQLANMARRAGGWANGDACEGTPASSMPMDCATATMEASRNAISSFGNTSSAGSGLRVAWRMAQRGCGNQLLQPCDAKQTAGRTCCSLADDCSVHLQAAINTPGL